MADSDQEGPGETGEDTDELLYPDVEREVRVPESTQAHPSRDHCDLLLDAIDAQLSRLQAQSHAVRAREDDGNGKRMAHTNAALGQSLSVSKDTGLGSTLPTNDPSTPVLHAGHSISETQDLSSENRSGGRDPDSAEEEDDGTGSPSWGEVAEEESESEQCRWRLELLLGRAEGGVEGSLPRRPDSVRTEDFAVRFRAEMMEPLGGVGDEETGPGSKISGEPHTWGPWGGAHRGREVSGTQAIGAEMELDLGEMVVVVKGIDWCHSGSHLAPQQDQDSPQPKEILCSRVDRRPAVENKETTVVTGGRASLGLEQGTYAWHPQLLPPEGDTEQTGDMVPGQVELSKEQTPSGREKSGVSLESPFTGRKCVSMTALTDCTPLCVHMSPGIVPSSSGTIQTPTPHAEGSGRGTVKHKSDSVAKKVNGSGTRVMSRCPAPESTECKLKVRMPSTGHTPLPHSLLRDTDTPLSPQPGVGGTGVEQRCESVAGHSPRGPSCPTPASPDCTDVVRQEAVGRAGFGSAPGPPSSSGTGVLTVSQSSMNTAEAEGVTAPPIRPAVRHLAGVPVKSFDSVTIDSDLDSVRTDRVRKHFRNALRCGAVGRCARDLRLEDLCTDQSDPDLLLEPRSKFTVSSSGLQAVMGNIPDGCRHARKARHLWRESPRYDCSDDEETDDVGEEEQEQTGLSALAHRGLVQKNSAPWRRRSGRLKRPHLRTLTGGWLEAMSIDRLLLEEALHTLRQSCLREEERLKQKREQLHDTELSLSTLLQQQKHAMQVLECAQARTEQAEQEGRGLEASLRDSRTQVDSTRSQLRMLQVQRDARAQDLQDLEAELTALRRHRAILQERKGAELENRLHTNSLSVLEREELDRQLDSAKTELFAEQRRARLKLDSLQERLEETQQELEQRVEEVRVLRESHTGLEEELSDAQRQREDLEQRRREELQSHKAKVQELQGRLEEQGGRVEGLEQLLAQREVQQQEAQGQLRALEEEKRSLEAQLLCQREEHCMNLRESQEQARRYKELELVQLRSELSSVGQQELQQVLRRAEEEKQEALKQQALAHALSSDALQALIQLKEEELRKTMEALERKEESARTQEEELRAQAQEARQAVDREHRKWEEERREGLQAQREALEDQARRAVERVSVEAERERRTSLGLQKKVVELQARVQEQDSELQLQQREHAAALTAVRGALRDEQREELQRLRRQLEQEAQREVSRLQQAAQQAQEEAHALQAALAARGRSQEEAGMLRAELQQKGWATELGVECQCLQELLIHCGATGGAVQLPHNPTLAQVVQTLRSVREQLFPCVSRLRQDLDTQRHETQQLARDKERELRAQREQLTVEREQALDSLKERLIQDHIEEVSSLQRAQLRDGSCESGGVATSLRRQLQEKDSELREVQRSMGRWKEQTAARLARKFEEELTAELDRCKAQLLKERRVPRGRAEQQRKLKRLETEVRQLTMEYGDPGVLRSTSTPSLLTADPPAAPGPPDLATFKLLRHLQSRVRQLRAENSAQSYSPVHLGSPLGPHLNPQLGAAGELSGSYLETIVPSSERHTRSRTQSRTVPN